MKDKVETVKKAPFGPVEVMTGVLAGMVFVPEDHGPVTGGKVKVKYAAPHDGPRCVVQHVMVRNEFREADKAEDVRIAFSRLFPANILCDAKSGYSDRTSGAKLQWDRQLGRFVWPMKKVAKAVKQANSEIVKKG